MKITIDDKICKKHGLTLEEALLMLSYRMSKDHTMTVASLEDREIIIYNGEEDDFIVPKNWSEVLDEILNASSGKTVKTDEELLALAVRIQECFPKTKMRDRFGRETSFYYRCNRTEVKNALKRFFTHSSYKDASDDDIVDAARRYVASFGGNYSGRMRLAKYFIWKNDVKLKEDGTGYVDQLSDLETFLENKDSEEEYNTSEDWLMSSRN